MAKSSFEPSHSDSKDESDTNLFSLASKFPTDSNLPASCLVQDDEEEDEEMPDGSFDYKDEQLQTTLLMLREQLKV